MTTDQTTPAPETTAPETESVGVSLNDIALAVRIVDLASERGAFKGPELSAIGTCRDRLAAFVKANAPAPAAPQEPVSE